ncbi:aromatic-ring-hydroxylating dioxygenase, beta subunit [Rhizorhabdus wittichii RW1]|uniref:Aromatic-ring-hydroxylating dioxygenase, beta subunit n=1 Tax=Rhizorhabdus wittichii (strain DSM 6014 / CCUG 31198 / JCM 15750 / NBRC 105917 / EY 4224 / RW1) TaxID=392499 RepID=A0A9J9LDJ8_RHIWR|nr:aromatic-ring-hydroxylating dioxygenase, beta subunit [Rhizorhabdus wittichii RW1]
MAGIVQTALELVEYEVRLLNDGRFRDWLDLYANDGRYWVPAEWGQASPKSSMSLLYEDRQVMEARVIRLESEYAWSNAPTVRAVRILSGLRLIEDHGDRWETAADFMMVQTRAFASREARQHAFAGSIRHSIVTEGNGLKIKLKRVDLLNPEEPTVQAPLPI